MFLSDGNTQIILLQVGKSQILGCHRGAIHIVQHHAKDEGERLRQGREHTPGATVLLDGAIPRSQSSRAVAQLP